MAVNIKLDPQNLLGKTEVQAASDALIHGIQFRVAMRDGVSEPLTEDYAPKRWDLEVERGIIVGVRIPS